MTDYDFVEIGTSDFATLIQHAGDKVGLSVEPVKDYYRSLPDRPNVKRVNAAISDYDGLGVMYYIPPSVIGERNLPNWLRGCNRLNNIHQTVKNKILKGKLEESMVVKENCLVLSVPTLIHKYNIKTIGYLKVDTEGHDCVIIDQFIELWSAGSLQKPTRIQFETNGLTLKKTREATIARLEALGYTIYRNKEDTVALL